MRTNPLINWLSQRNNLNAFTGDMEAHNQCMIASFVMMMQWLRRFLLDNKQPSFEFYDELTHYIIVSETRERARKLRFNSINHATKLNAMLEAKKIPYRFVSKNLDYIEMKQVVANLNSPVLIGTMETDSGHIVTYDGLIQNPYGRPDTKIHTGSCKYISVEGANLDYTDEFFMNMVFREMQNKQTSKTNVKRLCWYIEKSGH
jgi:hypothetical protein